MLPESDVSKLRIQKVPLRSEASSYALAFYALSEKLGKQEEAAKDLSALAELYNAKGGRELNYVLKSSPNAPKFVNQLAELAKSSPLTKQFLEFLQKSKKIGLAPEIAKSFEIVNHKANNQVETTITVAKEPTKEELDNILAHAKHLAGGLTILPTVEVDPSVESGYQLRVGDNFFDASGQLFKTVCLTALEKLESSLISSHSDAKPTEALNTPLYEGSLDLPPFLGSEKH
jgi:F0F1-type ATP synthase delta subunit